jgi:siroheme synthase (precorrin-2 oxidase/ferrochelatase)
MRLIRKRIANLFGKSISELSFFEAVLLQAAALAFFMVVIDLTKYIIKRVKNFFARWRKRR